MRKEIGRWMRGLMPWRERLPLVQMVRLHGIISAAGRLSQNLNVRNLAPALERAFEGRNLKAVALLINSPGGSAAQSMLIYQRIRALAAETGVPVYAFAEDAAASGGYLIACAADEIYANDSSVVGSVGVIAATFGFQQLMARLGVERRVYTSGTQKGLLDPFKPVDPADVERLGAVQGDIHETFKAIVRERRGSRLQGAEDELFSGAFWTGRQALALGFIDGLSDSRAMLRRKFGKDVQIRMIEPVRPRGRLLGLGSGAERAPKESGPTWLTPLVGFIEERSWWDRLGL